MLMNWPPKTRHLSNLRHKRRLWRFLPLSATCDRSTSEVKDVGGSMGSRELLQSKTPRDAGDGAVFYVQHST